MKKTFSARRNVLVPRHARPWGVALMLVAILIVAIRFLAPGFFIGLMSPVSRLASLAAAGAGNVSAVFKNPAKLQQEVDALTAEVAALSAENATLTAKAEDYQNLLGTRTEPVTGILAGILMRPPESPYDMLVVDQGSNAGVVPGAVVTGPSGAPIGTVTTATAGSARVTLYSAPGVSTGAWIGEGRVPVTLTGAGAGAFLATAPKDAGIAVGDAVYVAGPGAIAIGSVIRLDTDVSSPSVTLRIAPATNPATLTWVMISSSAP